MKKYISNNGITIELSFFERYNKEEVDKLAKDKGEDELDALIVKGEYYLDGVVILQQKYKKKAIELKPHMLKSINKMVEETTNEVVETSISEFYS